MTPRHRDFAGLAGWVLAVAVAAIVGSLGSLEAGSFYAGLARPAWAPPASVFGPVWTALYLMMAVAGWLHWRAQRPLSGRLVLVVFGIQLGLNALWSWLFFAWRLGGWAFLDIVLLWSAIAVLIGLMLRARSRVAACLLLPYLAWVSFATVLNAWLWQANPAVL